MSKKSAKTCCRPTHPPFLWQFYAVCRSRPAGPSPWHFMAPMHYSLVFAKPGPGRTHQSGQSWIQRAIHRVANLRQDWVDNRRKRVYALFERIARQSPDQLDGYIDVVLDRIVRKDGAASVHMLFESFALTTQVRQDLTGRFLQSVYERNPDHMLLAFMVTLDDARINDQALRTVLSHDTPCGHARNFLPNWAVGKCVTTGQDNEMCTILDWPAENTCNCSVLEHPLSTWPTRHVG